MGLVLDGPVQHRAKRETARHSGADIRDGEGQERRVAGGDGRLSARASVVPSVVRANELTSNAPVHALQPQPRRARLQLCPALRAHVDSESQTLAVKVRSLAHVSLEQEDMSQDRGSRTSTHTTRVSSPFYWSVATQAEHKQGGKWSWPRPAAPARLTADGPPRARSRSHYVTTSFRRPRRPTRTSLYTRVSGGMRLGPIIYAQAERGGPPAAPVARGPRRRPPRSVDDAACLRPEPSPRPAWRTV